MELGNLSNDELTELLVCAAGEERGSIVRVLHHLLEFDRRRLYREQGYSSLFDYCVRKLKYSHAAAYRRVAGARAIGKDPAIAGLLESGELSLCALATAAKSIEAEITTVAEIVGKSKREVELIVAKSEPVPRLRRERVKPVSVEAPALPLFSAPPVEERYELRFSVSRELYEQFEEAKALLSKSVPGELSLESIFSKLVTNYLKPKTRAGKAQSDTRYVPRAVKREVLKRDNCQCSFVAADGTRCTERKYLHLDHIVPYAHGGRTEASNLRLLCAVHNQLFAEKHFGPRSTSTGGSGCVYEHGALGTKRPTSSSLN